MVYQTGPLYFYQKDTIGLDVFCRQVDTLDDAARCSQTSRVIPRQASKLAAPAADRPEEAAGSTVIGRTGRRQNVDLNDADAGGVRG